MSVITSFLMEPAACFLSAAFIFFHARTDRRMKTKVLYLYYFVATVLMVRSTLLGIEGKTNIEIYNLLCLLTSVGLGVYFFHTLNRRWKKAVVVFFCLAQAGYYVSFNLVQAREPTFDSVGYVLLSTGIIIMSFMYMHQVLTNVTEDPLSMNFDFWFVCSQMIYHLGAFAIFLTFDYLTRKIMPQETYSMENRILLTNLWRVHNLLLFLTALITATGIVWIAYRRKSPSSP